jgi:hypothetical protein
MTVLWKNRKVRRYVDAAISGNGKPKWWPQTAPLRPHVEGVERGSAKPGRGGRRKRQRRAATTRAALEWLAVQATGRPSFWPRRLEKRPDRPTWPPLGRRERRRRAKLRRRRAWTEIRRAARAMLLAMPIIYRPASTEAMRREVNRVALRQRAAMKRHAPWILGASPTPGA